MPSETKALFLHAPREGLRAKTYILLFTMIVFGPLGDVLLGKGMRSIGAMDNLVRANVLQLFFRAFSTRTIWLGIFSLSIFFVAYILVLSWADFSYVQPASAMSYGLTSSPVPRLRPTANTSGGPSSRFERRHATKHDENSKHYRSHPIWNSRLLRSGREGTRLLS
jgi:hypothetical protein